MENMVNNLDLFSDVYRGKRVLVTGHTGFKGSWLSMWLLKLGAKVAGFSLFLPSDPCNFEVLNLKEKIRHYEGDVRDINELKKVFDEFRPEIVFHLAAQSLVRKSYDEPKDTFDVNLGGTVNMLECIRNSASCKTAVIITSDKCYKNIEQLEGYHEEDILGGYDPYSASKACAELASKAYIASYFTASDSPKIATTRAGNVIGGGDWAKDRIIPDCVRAWSKNEEAIIRNPKATRPWQHVLEPLSGYLSLGEALINDQEKVRGEAFNFGPNEKEVESVQELVDLFLESWPAAKWRHVPPGECKKEASLLKLDCRKAGKALGWHSVLNFHETIEFTAKWYKNYYSEEKDNYEFSSMQIDDYISRAVDRGLAWVKKRG